MSAHSGKTAIVTGASTGIGRASAEALAKAGFTVFGTSRRATGNGANRVSMLTCDVTDDESVNALVSTVLAETGRVDVLVNNAGIGLLGGAEESSISQVQALFDVNLFGVMRVTNAVLPSMRRLRTRTHHQHQLGARPLACSLLRALFGDQARARRLLRITRSRDPRLQHPRLAHRAGLHTQRLRTERARAGFAVEGIRSGPGGRPRARAGCHDHGRSAGSGGRRGAAGRNRRAPAATLHRRQGRATGQRVAPVRARRRCSTRASASRCACLPERRGASRKAEARQAVFCPPGRPS